MHNQILLLTAAKRSVQLLCLVICLFGIRGNTNAYAQIYDPLVIASENASEPLDLIVKDAGRRRDIPIRIYLPQGMAASPVILFSHGLGGSREGSAYLGVHWAARGYVVVYLQHPGSDTSVWQGKRVSEGLGAIQKAAGLKNFLLRVTDVSAVLDQLERWNRLDGHALKGRLDLTRVGMSGHSFGAVTTQAVSGQSFRRAFASFTDPRIKAAIAFSPSSPRGGGDPKRSFGKVKIPWMLMTGTKDLSIIGDSDMESRLAVYPALAPGGKYEVVLHNAEHSAFTDRALPGDREKRNPNHHRAVLALSTAFWDAWLKGDAEAKAWLDGEGPRSILEKNDRWQRK